MRGLDDTCARPGAPAAHRAQTQNLPRALAGTLARSSALSDTRVHQQGFADSDAGARAQLFALPQSGHTAAEAAKADMLLLLCQRCGAARGLDYELHGGRKPGQFACRPAWSSNGFATAVRALPAEHLLGASVAERALERTNASLSRLGLEVTVGTLAVWTELKHRGMAFVLSNAGVERHRSRPPRTNA